jgi:polyisoprenoid-binding protein YceI
VAEQAAVPNHVSGRHHDASGVMRNGRWLRSKIGLLLLIFVVTPTWADWSLNNAQSQLSFISIKKGDIAEVHRFDQLDGSVDANGNVSLTIQLASVDTAIPIRDQRMREMLFNTNAFPRAVLTAKVDASALNQLEAGDVSTSSLEGKLSMHGQTGTVSAELAVARLGPNKLLVSSRKPVVLQAADYDFLEGVEKLREVAGLSSISKAVPVSFVLTFDKK